MHIMIKWASWLTLWFGTLIILSCEKDCDSKHVGEVHFSEATKSLEVYQEGQQYQFKSDSGEIATYYVARETGENRICIKVICRPFDPYKNRGCEYLVGDSYYYTLRDTVNGLFLHTKASINPIADVSSDFYEDVTYGIDYTQASRVTNYRYDTLAQGAFVPYYQEFIEKRDVLEAGSKTLTNVWYLGDASAPSTVAMAINEAGYIIAYWYAAKWWHLEQ